MNQFQCFTHFEFIDGVVGIGQAVGGGDVLSALGGGLGVAVVVGRV